LSSGLATGSSHFSGSGRPVVRIVGKGWLT
jgi:hypothetical protein